MRLLFLASLFHWTPPLAIAIQDTPLLLGLIDFGKSVQELSQKGTGGLYDSTSLKHRTPLDERLHLPFGKGVYAWQLSHGEGDWKRPCFVNIALFQNGGLGHAITLLTLNGLETLETLLSEHVDPPKVGLYYKTYPHRTASSGDSSEKPR